MMVQVCSILRGAGLTVAATIVLSPPGWAAPAAAPPVIVPVDAELKLNGVGVACTGIGADARALPKWQAYGVRVEFSNIRNEYLPGGAIRLRDAAGRELLSVQCEAPWILLQLPDGAYQVEGRLPDPNIKPRSARISTPTRAQQRVVLQFPDA
jgi:hypothetical protein